MHRSDDNMGWHGWGNWKGISQANCTLDVMGGSPCGGNICMQRREAPCLRPTLSLHGPENYPIIPLVYCSNLDHKSSLVIIFSVFNHKSFLNFILSRGKWVCRIWFLKHDYSETKNFHWCFNKTKKTCNQFFKIIALFTTQHYGLWWTAWEETNANFILLDYAPLYTTNDIRAPNNSPSSNPTFEWL